MLPPLALSPNEKMKFLAALAAVQYIENGMIVGLGSGTTSSYFISCLIYRCKMENLTIYGIPTSEASRKQAADGGIKLVDINCVESIDIAVDGADEIDPAKRMIKGGGGALLREKIIANFSKEMIVIVDENKIVPQLGKFPLPIEIIPFGYKATLLKLAENGYKGNWRRKPNGELFITDNGNYIADIHFSGYIENPEEEEAILKCIPGVVETGFFIGTAGRVIVGFSDGRTEVL